MLYQRTLSPDHGLLSVFYPYGFCRLTPTCSEYAKRVFLARGVFVGVLLTLKRLLGCHPWKEPSRERLVKIAMQ